MSYAAVITHVQADAESAPRLTSALEVARRFDAALIGVAAEMIPPMAFDGGFYSIQADWITVMRDNVETRLKAAGERFSAATQCLGDKAILLSGLRVPTPALVAASRAADLIVAGGAPRNMRDAYVYCDPAELAITSGRPVLVAPPSAPPLQARNVVLAWKDTREARRALSDSLPFLERAERVTVVAVTPAADATEARLEVDDVAGALARRNINAVAKVVEHAHPDGFQIMRQASLEGADLIVSGAYGHSRLGEWVFGGVTADLLSQDEVYLLLSH
ncbi:MAG TPA: universal stress protein [Caulobacteraceae bacterium]|nr:universal stress protein [Caulobacteraceae bacterium]